MTTVVDYQPVPLSAKDVFDAQVATTGDAKQAVEVELARLKQSPDHSKKGSSLAAKFEFLEVNLRVYDSMVEYLTLLQGTMEALRTEHRLKRVALLPATEMAHNRIYVDMTAILKTMELRFKAALGIRDGSWQGLYQSAKSFAQRHKSSILGALAAFGISGAAALAAGHSYFGVCLMYKLTGLAFFKSACVCAGGGLTWGSLAISAACGAIGGLLAAGIILGLWYFLSPTPEPESEQLREQKRREADVKRMLSEINKKPQEIVDQYQELRDWVEQNFCQIDPTAGTECLICFQVITHGAAGGEKGVRSPNCQGLHFVHSKCSSRWVESEHGTLACVMCRV